MNEQLMNLLKLINENKTLNEIREITNLNNEELVKNFNDLREFYYLIEKSYHYDGNISYSIFNPFDKQEDNITKIITPKDTEEIRLIITGDTHLGHINDNIYAIDKMMEYCIDEGIHNIFHTGDLFEGLHTGREKTLKVNDLYKQLEYGIENYPFDELINTYVCLGNHDATFWLEEGIDLKTYLLNKRPDLIPIGYGNGKIKILDNTFFLHHPISKCDINSLGEIIKNSIIIKGHSHKFKVIGGVNSLVIYSPTLSNVSTNNNKYNQLTYPSMIDATFKLEKGLIKDAYFQQFIIINDNLVRISEIKIPTLNLERYKESDTNKKEIKPKLTSLSNEIEEKNKIEDTSDVKSLPNDADAFKNIDIEDQPDFTNNITKKVNGEDNDKKEEKNSKNEKSQLVKDTLFVIKKLTERTFRIDEYLRNLPYYHSSNYLKKDDKNKSKKKKKITKT